jgi:hypothetical protein
LKVADHCIDASRYACFSHKVAIYNPYAHNPTKYTHDRFGRQSNF